MLKICIYTFYNNSSFLYRFSKKNIFLIVAMLFCCNAFYSIVGNVLDEPALKELKCQVGYSSKQNFDNAFFKVVSKALKINENDMRHKTLDYIKEMLDSAEKKENKNIDEMLNATMRFPIQGLLALDKEFNGRLIKGNIDEALSELKKRIARIKDKLELFSVKGYVFTKEGEDRMRDYESVRAGVCDARKIIDEGFEVLRALSVYLEKIGSFKHTDVKRVKGSEHVIEIALKVKDAAFQLCDAVKDDYSKFQPPPEACESLADFAWSNTKMIVVGGAAAVFSYPILGMACVPVVLRMQRKEKEKWRDIQKPYFFRCAKLQVYTEIVSLEYAASALNVALEVAVKVILPEIVLLKAQASRVVLRSMKAWHERRKFSAAWPSMKEKLRKLKIDFLTNELKETRLILAQCKEQEKKNAANTREMQDHYNERIAGLQSKIKRAEEDVAQSKKDQHKIVAAGLAMQQKVDALSEIMLVLAQQNPQLQQVIINSGMLKGPEDAPQPKRLADDEVAAEQKGPAPRVSVHVEEEKSNAKKPIKVNVQSQPHAAGGVASSSSDQSVKQPAKNGPSNVPVVVEVNEWEEIAG